MAITRVASAVDGNNGATVTITKASLSGLANDDYVFMFYGAEVDLAFTVIPTGFTKVDEKLTTAGRDLTSGYLWKKMTDVAGEPTSWVTGTISTSEKAVVTVVYRGVDLTDYLDAAATSTDGTNDLTPDAPDITTVANGAFIVSHHAGNDPSNTSIITAFGAPSELNLVAGQETVANDVGFSVVADLEKATAGSQTIGSWTHTTDNNTSEWHCRTISLKPDSGATTRTVTANLSSLLQKQSTVAAQMSAAVQRTGLTVGALTDVALERQGLTVASNLSSKLKATLLTSAKLESALQQVGLTLNAKLDTVLNAGAGTVMVNALLDGVLVRQTCYEASLTNVTDPGIHTGHFARYRYRKDAAGGEQVDLLAEVLQGSTVIWSQSHSNIGATETTVQALLNTTEAGNITNYSDLRMRFTFTMYGGGTAREGRITWARFQVPAAAGAVTKTQTANLSTALQQQDLLTAVQLSAALQTTPTLAAQLTAALQASPSLATALDTKLQAEATAAAKLDTALQTAVTVDALMDVAVERQDILTRARLDTALQDTGTVAALLDTALLTSPTVAAALSAFLAAAGGVSLSARLDVLVKALGLTVSAKLSAAVAAQGQTVAGRLDALLESPEIVTAVLDTVLLTSPQLAANLSAFLVQAGVNTVTAEMSVAILTTESTTANLSVAVRDTLTTQLALSALLQQTETVTADLDVLLSREQLTVASNLDTFLQLAGVNTVAANLDALLLATGELVQAQLSVALQQQDITVAANLSATVARAQTLAARVDVLLQRTATARVSLDAAVARTDLLLTADLDTTLQRQLVVGALLDAILVGGENLVAARLDSSLQRQGITLGTLMSVVLAGLISGAEADRICGAGARDFVSLHDSRTFQCSSGGRTFVA